MQDAKAAEAQRAAQEVEAHESWVARITSVHKDCGAAWDWRRLANAPPPAAPEPTHDHEHRARSALERFRPSWLDRVFRRTDKKRAALAAAVDKGRRADADRHAEARAEHDRQTADWSEMRDLAARILAMDVVAFRDATDELSPFAELSELGSHIEFTFRGDGVATATIAVNEETVVPREVKSLLQSGKVSTKKMPVGRFYELYQDYVAGAALRIARELFALLPVHTVYVTATGQLLNTSSGHLEMRPVLSVKVPRQTLARLRFETLNPSDALGNFVHRMEFKKTKGFSPVVALEPDPTG